ncbi:MAG: 23S rRNA (adenine(2503)-C(2))-methyltransferase RlmN [Oscillospiraceae bacterium]|nr:23S rRNA (adenine(2503)-C(2))-methyltransferase RlmN [Oscillospiraceae bacterium]
MEKIDIKSLEYLSLIKNIIDLGESKFRGNQIYDWLHNKNIVSFSDMTNISKIFREKLNENYYINNITIDKKLISEIDGTVKYLYKLIDNNFIETVVMKYKYGNTICVSSQVGCKMGCNFCASTIDGYMRNLNSSEILDQIYKTEEDLGEKITNIVMMGIGEPLDNFDNVVNFIKMISDENGRNIGKRNITLSTCGIVDKINELAELKFPITLAISLHAPNDYIRSKTMPINKVWNIEELLKSCYNYYYKTGRRISFEYAVINGINDSAVHALELIKKLSKFDCHVNLIPVNKIAERDYNSSKNNVSKFKDILEKNKIKCTIRRSLGADINAACGQLRREQTKL